MRLELLNDKVIAVRAIFSTEQTRRESIEALVVQLSMQYGEPRRIWMTPRLFSTGAVGRLSERVHGL